jgi:hypothetical protein
MYPGFANRIRDIIPGYKKALYVKRFKNMFYVKGMTFSGPW